MKFATSNFVFALIVLIFSCTEQVGNNNKSKVVLEDQKGDKVSENSFVEEYLVRDLPIVDSTSFDQFSDEFPLTIEQAKILELDKILLNSDFNSTEKHINYRLELNTRYKTVVFTFFPNENEIETVLVNYDLDFHVIDFKTIAYDEIAESCRRKMSEIDATSLLVMEMNFCSNSIVKTNTNFSFTNEGKIIQQP